MQTEEAALGIVNRVLVIRQLVRTSSRGGSDPAEQTLETGRGDTTHKTDRYTQNTHKTIDQQPLNLNTPHSL